MNTINTNDLQLIELDLELNTAILVDKTTGNDFNLEFELELEPVYDVLFDDRTGGIGSVKEEYFSVSFLDVTYISDLYDGEGS